MHARLGAAIKEMKERILIALDVSSRDQALNLVRELKSLTGMFKVGSQLYMAAGPAIVKEIIDNGGKVFLDLKFHDIPNTVKQAAIEAAKRGVSMMTIHASGGRNMMETVARGLQENSGGSRPVVVAVTVLTSIDEPTLREVGVPDAVESQVRRLALLAQDCGIDGVVCSPQEIQLLRKAVKPDFRIVTPGIRMPEQSIHDQQRIATPRSAIEAGADFIVVGRAVTEDPSPRKALEAMMESLK